MTEENILPFPTSKKVAQEEKQAKKNNEKELVKKLFTDRANGFKAFENALDKLESLEKVPCIEENVEARLQIMESIARSCFTAAAATSTILNIVLSDLDALTKGTYQIYTDQHYGFTHLQVLKDTLVSNNIISEEQLKQAWDANEARKQTEATKPEDHQK